MSSVGALPATKGSAAAGGHGDLETHGGGGHGGGEHDEHGGGRCTSRSRSPAPVQDQQDASGSTKRARGSRRHKYKQSDAKLTKEACNLVGEVAKVKAKSLGKELNEVKKNQKERKDHMAPRSSTAASSDPPGSTSRALSDSTTRAEMKVSEPKSSKRLPAAPTARLPGAGASDAASREAEEIAGLTLAISAVEHAIESIAGRSSRMIDPDPGETLAFDMEWKARLNDSFAEAESQSKHVQDIVTTFPQHTKDGTNRFAIFKVDQLPTLLNQLKVAQSKVIDLAAIAAAGQSVENAGLEEEAPTLASLPEDVLELRAALNESLTRILDASGDSFDDKAPDALRRFRAVITQIKELPVDVGNYLLAELNEKDKKTMLEFLSRVSNEKRGVAKVSQTALDRLLKCPCYQETWESGGRYINIFKDRKQVLLDVVSHERKLSEAKAEEPAKRQRPSTASSSAGASASALPMSGQASVETQQPILDAEGVQYGGQAELVLSLGLPQVIACSERSNPFDTEAAAAFNKLKKGVEMIRGLPDSVANDALGGVGEKKSVIEFLLRLAKEKAMFSRQVKSTLKMLLKCPAWRETLEEFPQLKTKVDSLFDAEEAP